MAALAGDTFAAVADTRYPAADTETGRHIVTGHTEMRRVEMAVHKGRSAGTLAGRAPGFPRQRAAATAAEAHAGRVLSPTIVAEGWRGGGRSGLSRRCLCLHGLSAIGAEGNTSGNFGMTGDTLARLWQRLL